MTENFEKKEDLRVRRTKKLLCDALLKLVEKKPFEKISVCDICNEAMVHRATFYTHFCDKYELLNFSMDKHLPLYKFDDFENDTTNFTEIADSIVNDICENKKIYASILKKNREVSIVDHVQKRLEKKICERIKKQVENTSMLTVKPEFCAGFYAGACMSVITKWLIGELDMTKEELINSLNTILNFVPEYLTK